MDNTETKNTKDGDEEKKKHMLGHITSLLEALLGILDIICENFGK